MRRFAGFCLGVMVLLVSGGAYAVDPASVPKAKQTKPGLYLTARETMELVGKNPSGVLFLDVRTPAEVMFIGMPTSTDANVPYMLTPEFPVWDAAKSTLKLEANPDFVAAVRRRLAAKELTPDSPVVLMCRSGDRSAAAVNLLADSGFKTVYTVVDGFEGDVAKDGPTAGQRTVNGWKNAGLPWSFKLDKAKMYRLDD